MCPFLCRLYGVLVERLLQCECKSVFCLHNGRCWENRKMYAAFGSGKIIKYDKEVRSRKLSYESCELLAEMKKCRFCAYQDAVAEYLEHLIEVLSSV